MKGRSTNVKTVAGPPLSASGIRVENDIDDCRVGDCFPAAVASVLELKLGNVPHFYQQRVEEFVRDGMSPREAWKALHNDTEWYFRMQDWLGQYPEWCPLPIRFEAKEENE